MPFRTKPNERANGAVQTVIWRAEAMSFSCHLLRLQHLGQVAAWLAVGVAAVGAGLLTGGERCGLVCARLTVRSWWRSDRGQSWGECSEGNRARRRGVARLRVKPPSLDHDRVRGLGVLIVSSQLR